MKLIVQELHTERHQDIRIGRNSIRLKAMRPHIYKAGFPAGSLKMQIQDLDGRVIGESETIAISAITAATYSHGYLRFYIDAHLKADTVYRIALIAAGGYSFAEAAWVGWCNDFDLQKVPREWTPNMGVHAALDLELWDEAEFLRGAS